MPLDTHEMTDLGYTILLDRYAQKDPQALKNLAVGNTVIAIVDNESPDGKQKREIGTVVAIHGDDVEVAIHPHDTRITLNKRLIDRPLETSPEEIQIRVAKGIASVEPEKKVHWQQEFEWLLSDWKFIPGGRILTAAGTDQDLTCFNCVSAETLIHTQDGLITAKDLVGKTIKVLSKGGVYREAVWNSYGTQQLWEVTMKNGDVLYATENHEWIVTKPEGGEKVVTTAQLEGRHIPMQHVANIQVDQTDPQFIEGLQHGYVYGDGTHRYSHWKGERVGSKTYVPAFTEHNKAFVSKWFEKTSYQPSRDAIVASTLPTEWKDLPTIDRDTIYLRGFIAGLIAADGHVDKRGSVMLHQADMGELVQIRHLAAKAGLPVVSIKLTRDTNPWTGDYAPMYKMQFAKAAFVDSNLILLENHRQNLETGMTRGKQQTMKVVSVRPTQRVEEVFCCVEPETHTMVIEGGYLTKQCFVIPSPEDSRQGIMTTLTNMAELMSRGGGVGINVSTLRPKNARVEGVNGRSSGAVSWAALYSYVTGLIEQAGSRRGALMLILNDWHPDVLRFITAKETAGNIVNANISVGVSDALMEAVENDADWTLRFPDTKHEAYATEWVGDLEAWESKGYPVNVYSTIKARELWQAITQSAWKSAEPGLWFRERANKMSNSWYYPEGRLIATNPCLTGDSIVNTSLGMKTMEDLYRTQADFSVVTDSRFGTDTMQPSSRVIQTGVKPVFKLTTSDGYTLKATGNHKIMTSAGWKELKDINIGEQIHILNRLGAFGTEGNLALGRTIGWLVGDGHFSGKRAYLSFYGEEQELAPAFAGYVNEINGTPNRIGVSVQPTHNRSVVSSQRLRSVFESYGLAEKKLQVPEVVFNGTEEMQRGYLQGLFSADGSVQGNLEKGMSIRLTSVSTSLLEQVQILLTNFGIKSKIYKFRKMAQVKPMPDQKGGMKDVNCQAVHELSISKNNIEVFAREVRFLHTSKNKKMDDLIYNRKRTSYKESFLAKVESIVALGEEIVYDLQQPTTHSFIANGIVVHNCGEQPLSGWAVCNLGAINLAAFWDSKKKDVNWLDLEAAASIGTRFLDNVIDWTSYHFEENRIQEQSERRIGLGIMGLAELLIKAGVRYGTPEAELLTERIFHKIARSAYLTSSNIASEKGSFEHFDADKFLASGYMMKMDEDVRDQIRYYGMRNVTLLTVAPTGTTGTMINTSTGIEPFFSWNWWRKGRLGVFEETAPVLAAYYEQMEIPVDEHGKAIEQVTLPSQFVTAMEMSPEEHVRMMAAAQRWVDSAISKTVNVPNEWTVEQVDELYRLMYRLGCKGGTIYRDGSRTEQVLHLKKEDATGKSEAKSVESTLSNDEVQRLIEKTMAEVKEGLAAERKAEIALAIANEPVSSDIKLPKRPIRLPAVVLKGTTPYGNVFITISEDPNGTPYELFITIGKSGSDLAAQGESMGRTFSAAIQSQPVEKRLTMLKILTAQNSGIGGARQVGLGPKRVSSFPDAVAKIISDQYLSAKNVADAAQAHIEWAGDLNQVEDAFQKFAENRFVDLPTIGSLTVEAAQETVALEDTVVDIARIKGANMCPDCHNQTFLRVDGCAKCVNCGHSEC